MLLQELVDLLEPIKIKGSLEIEVTEIESDSRKIKDGSLFIAIDGYTVDGHNYIETAVKSGATTIIAEKEIPFEIPTGVTYIIVKSTQEVLPLLANHFYDYPSKKLKLIGITGTNGKTSTSKIIHQILKDSGIKTGLIGTMHIDIDGEIIESKNTTPDALELQKLFYKMVEREITHVVMEVSSHALALNRVYGCEFSAAVFTNLTQDHLDFHKTMEEYKQAKGLLFSRLKSNAIAVLNNDEPVSKEYMERTKAKVITYGIEEKANIKASEIYIGPNGTTFKVEVGNIVYLINSKLIGMFNVYNLLAAITVCVNENVPKDVILNSITKIKGVRGRFEGVFEGQDFNVIVDYAHTPDSLENVLETAKTFTKGDIITVIGCGGDRDKTKRPIMAKIAEQLSDFVLLTSDNPRSEEPEQILLDMEKGLENPTKYQKIIDRKEAIASAIKKAKTNDCVIIAGKGHETYQIIGNKTTHFDDKEEATEFIKEKLKNMVK